jgi:hypothetical protein
MGSFELCSGLENIILPNSLNIISTKAFAYCSNLTNIRGYLDSN